VIASADVQARAGQAAVSPDVQAFMDATSILRCLQAERRGEPAPAFAREAMNAAFDRLGVLRAAVLRSALVDVLDCLERRVPR
jgi:hypothetical protein